MVELNMIDIMGYGIYDMYVCQVWCYFLMLDYDLDEVGVVKLMIYGGVVDLVYSCLLIQQIDLLLVDVLVLDCIQKKFFIFDDVVVCLKCMKFIEGCKLNYYVFVVVVEVMVNKVDYICMCV